MFENYQYDSEGLLQSWCVNGSQALIAFSLQGKSHKRQNMPLQDSHAIRVLPNGWNLAVVCDGVGSKPCSDEGARTAANAFANFVTDFWGSYQNPESILNLMKCAALYATGKMLGLAKQNERSIHDYSTTLHAVIYANGMLYWFHSGDGGIIALMKDGTYQPLTNPQKEGEYVLPLLEGPQRWILGKSDAPVQSVLLCTDGIYDKIAGTILRRHGEGIDKGIAAFFLSPWAFEDWSEPESIAKQMTLVFDDASKPNDFYPIIAKAVCQGGSNEEEAFCFVRDEIFSDDRPLHSLKSVQDDITVSIIQDIAGKPRVMPLDYYKGPDWEAINRSIAEILYG